MTDKVTLQDIAATAERVKNWGRWGADDEVGALNNISPQDIVNAARLIRKGKVFSLALNFDSAGPQSGLWGNRFNPIHTMTATGTDAVAGRQESIKIRYAYDMVTMPLQCGTQWDALVHIFNGEKMWNGYVARHKGVDSLEDGYGISTDELEKCAAAQGVEIRKGDFVIIRTGHMERCLSAGKWEGYAGGNAPGLRFETAEWIRKTDMAAICADTWGCEVRPNETTVASQPWHWVVIPMIGISMGEIFYLKDLAADCAQDHVYEF